MTTIVPRIVISGTSSGVGKTTITTGVVAAIAKRGLTVQPFKCGPDYIDPGYLSTAAGLPCRNLDTWMVPQPNTLELFCRAAQASDVAIIEGVMGLFDGRGGAELEGSTAEIALLLKAPVILIIDVGKMSGSAAAVALGYKQLHPEINLAGIIANNVGSPRHLQWVTEAIEKKVGIPLVGHLSKNKEIALPERHLGLLPVVEGQESQEALERIREQIEATINIEEILRLAREAGSLPQTLQTGLFPSVPQPQRITIAVARDKAFDFYYEDNLDLLAAWGAKLIFVSPLEDAALPQGIQGIYIGGGFPEMYAEELVANSGFRRSVAKAAEAGITLYAECGGLMYLAQGIIDFEGKEHPMVGLVPGKAVMQKELSKMGYTTVEALRDSPLASNGQRLRGHVFHWSKLPDPVKNAAYRILGSEDQLEGVVLGPGSNVLASYLHLHFGSDLLMARRFVESCAT